MQRKFTKSWGWFWRFTPLKYKESLQRSWGWFWRFAPLKYKESLQSREVDFEDLLL